MLVEREPHLVHGVLRDLDLSELQLSHFQGVKIALVVDKEEGLAV